MAINNNNKNLSNATGTSSSVFAIDQMTIEYINDGVDDGAKITIPGYNPIFLRALNPNVASKWYTGEGPPPSTLGNIGDFYLNTLTGSVYEHQETWAVITTLTGPSGPQGPTGPQGPQGPQGPPGPQVSSLGDLSDVQVIGPRDFDILVYDLGSERWINVRKENIVDGGNF